MFKYISTVVTSTNPNLILSKITIILAIILVLFWLHKLSAPPNEKHQEGFTQKEAFILKQNQDVYDNFYAEVYDGLNDTKNRCQKELMKIVNMTEPTTKHSVFLDVGSGTGHMINELHEAGYTAYGIDKSPDMVEYAEQVNPAAEFKLGDVMDPMAFDKSTFSHILCSNFTLYLFEDKMTFFRNCYYWMIPNGYLIVHLVEPNKFDMSVPKGNPVYNLFAQPSSSSNKRIIEANVDFYDFNYSASYKFPEDSSRPLNCTAANCVTFKETFVDRHTKHVRQNEQKLYMNKIDDVLNMASRAGFIFHGKSNMKDCGRSNELPGDENQYIYIFERPL